MGYDLKDARNGKRASKIEQKWPGLRPLAFKTN